ncbi:MAG: efflux RND transporter periplasmic adaptor subunit [Pseudomonadota bacterium]
MKSTVSARFVSLILLAAIAACSQGPATEDEGPRIRPAKLLTVEEDQIVRTVNLPAVIGAKGSTDLAFEVGGLLQEFPVEEGMQVSAGDLIGKLEQRQFQNEVATAKAQFDNAEAEYQRAERLLQQDAIARSVVDQRRASRDVARANLDTARKRLEDSVLTAPFDGVIARRFAEPFQNVSPMSAVVTLETTGAAEAVVQVPATLVVQSEQLEPLGSQVVLDAAPDVPMQAELFSFATQADAAAQTFEARFSFEPPEGLVILPGMTGTVQLRMQRREGDMALAQIIIPLEAVVSEAGNPFVFKVDPQSYQLTRTPIVVAPSDDGRLAVVEGLTVGDTIVAAGAAFLQDGMTIRPYEG